MIANICSLGKVRSEGALDDTGRMQVTSQYRIDAPIEWVRSFLLIGITEDNLTVAGDVVEIRQHDRVLDLVVRNTLSSDGSGGTVLDVDANLQLLGLARVVGGLRSRRVRRTLERRLDRLPAAIEQALDEQQAGYADEADAGADDSGMVEDGPGG